MSLIEEEEKLEHLDEVEKEIRKKRQVLITSLGIKTPEEKIAFDYVKRAKDLKEIQQDDIYATEYFDKAISIAPNLGYIYGEYSKFEFFRNKNREKGISLARKAEPQPQPRKLYSLS